MKGFLHMLLRPSSCNQKNTINRRNSKKQKFLSLSFSLFFVVLLSNSGFTEEILLTQRDKFAGEKKIGEVKPEQNQKKEPVEITADTLERIEEKDTIIGRGHVEIFYQDMHVYADKIQINSKTGKGVAFGNVMIEDKSSKVTGSKMFFDINSKKGEILNAEGNFGSEYFFTGKKIKKTGEDQYKIYNGSLTTCFGDNPTWIFKCDYADLTIENYAFLKNPSLRVKDIPFFYLPYGYIPLKTKRATGFLFPVPGYSNRDGLFINNSFFWAINDQVDTTISLDYLEKKGVKPSLEFRYIPTKKMAGQFNGAYLEENDTGREFWKIDFNHNQELNYGIKATAKVDLLSDNNYDKEYANTTEERTRRISDSYLTFTKNWESRSVEILTRYRKSIEFNREETYNILPQVVFRNQREKILNSPLYFNMESSYTGFDKKTNSLDNDVQRFDLHPQLSLPFTALPWMTFTPTLGFRETYYSRGIDSSGNKTSEGFSRELYDITTTFEGPKSFRIFSLNNSAVPKIKHIIEPRIIHKYIPDMDNTDRNKIIVFDGIDNIGPLNIVQYSLTNRFLKKLILNKDSFTTEEVLRLEISQSYDMREATRSTSDGTGRRPFSDVRWDIDSHIWVPIRLNVDGTYNVYDRHINTSNVELGLTPESFWSFYFERRYIKDQSTFIIGSLGLDLKKGWEAQYSVRYDELNKEFQENDFSIKYFAQCWDISVDFINRYNYINGQREIENKFFFLITLKGIGTIGKKRNVNLLHSGL